MASQYPAGANVPNPGALTDLREVLRQILEQLSSGMRVEDRLRQLVESEAVALIKTALDEQWTVRGSVGMGTPADVPWIGIFSPGERASAQTGFYVVYLFAADGSGVYVSLNQGTERVRGGLPPIQKRAIDLRLAAGLSPEPQTIDLRSNAMRARKYE